jgi:hypothetical protein
MRIIYLAIILLVFASCTSTNNKQSNNLIEPERLQLMKDYAFCKCLEFSLGTEISQQINNIDASKSVLYDIANLWGNAHIPLDSIAQIKSQAQPQGQIADHDSKKTIILDCLQFHRSEDLDAFVKTLK